MSDLSRNIVLDVRPIVTPLGSPAPPLVLADSSRYRNNGVVTGATWYQLPSGVWVFNHSGADQYIDANGVLAVKSNTGTFMCWAYGSGSILGLSNPAFALVYEYYVSIQTGVNIVSFIVGANTQDLVTGVIMEANAWKHVAVSSNGATTSLVINGVPKALAGGPGNTGAWIDDLTVNPVTGVNTVEFGGLNRGGVHIVDLTGYTAGQRFFTPNLSVTEILQIFEAEKRYFGVQ